MNLIFKPLSEENLEEAVSVATSIFPEEISHIREVYEVSLRQNKSEEYWKTRRILEYFVAMDSHLDKIVAITGFYQLTEHSKDEIWLGWYGVSPSERGKGIGKKTLEWTMEEAKKRGYEVFKLWTTTDPGEKIAQKLYDDMGIYVYKKELNEETGDTVLYREMKL